MSESEIWEFWLFYNSPSDVCKGSATGGETSDFAAYVNVCRLLKPAVAESARKEASNYTLIRAVHGTKPLSDALQILEKAGLTPKFTRAISHSERGNYLPIRRERAITEQRLNQCEYLRLGYSDARIGYHFTTQYDLIIGMMQKEEHAKTAHIGSFSPVGLFGVSPTFNELFCGAGLQGVRFNPIRWEPFPASTFIPTDPTRTHWLSAEKEMPRCLTPRVGFSGELTGVHFWENEDLIRYAHPHMECGWDDEGRRDFVLRFRRKEVEAMGEFDIARTHEWIHLIGEKDPIWFPQLIVSQRFRQWAKKQRFKLHYWPCELVGQ